MHPRYFIGIALPDDISSTITAVQKKLAGQYDVMEPVVPHITLLHPNILMTLSPLYFIPLAKKAADAALPINLELTKIAMFDSRVLHIAVKGAALHHLHDELIELLPHDVRARYEIGRKFTPHVTLAQSKPLQTLDSQLITDVSTQMKPLLPQTFEVRHLSQYKSQRARTYTVQQI